MERNYVIVTLCIILRTICLVLCVACCSELAAQMNARATLSMSNGHWRRQGGPGGPAPPNRRAKIFLVKMEGLSSLPPAKSGRACYDNPTGRGHFYQMPNKYTCIAYLIEIRKFRSKTWFIKVLILRPKML